MFIILSDLSLLNVKKREKHPWRSVTVSKVAGFSQQPNRTSPQIAIVLYCLNRAKRRILAYNEKTT